MLFWNNTTKDCFWWQKDATDVFTKSEAERAFVINDGGSWPPPGQWEGSGESAQRTSVGALGLPLLEIVSVFGVLGILISNHYFVVAMKGEEEIGRL